MHQLIQDGLEEYLSGTLDSASRGRFDAHLKECPMCREQMEEMNQLSSLLQSLRDPAPETVTPAAGFYARVSMRIEQEQDVSIWSLLLQPLFAKRVALASLLFLAMVGGLVLSGEPESMGLPTAEQVMALDGGHRTLPPGGDVARGHMLYTLASYE
ncbi:MAG: anti-sigma factor family protein [Bryobacteraceae bacterium]